MSWFTIAYISTVALVCLTVVGCTTTRKTVTLECRHIAISHYLAAAEKYGEQNVELWVLRTPDGVNGHMQCHVFVEGRWWWMPIVPLSLDVPLQRQPEKGYYPTRKINLDNAKRLMLAGESSIW